MRRAEIEEEDLRQILRQREFRMAADVAATAWSRFAEVQAVAVIGSVARPLWKEIPRFLQFRRKGIEIWHECSDLDLALWVDSQHRLGELRHAVARALQKAFAAHVGTRVVNEQLDVFLFEPDSDRYLGRLCRFSECPKGKSECLTPGCGAVPFNRVFEAFVPRPDLLGPAAEGMLYRRGTGRLRSALDLPTVEEDR